jgi:hypothetical protein
MLSHVRMALLVPWCINKMSMSNHKSAKHLQKYASLGFYLDNFWKFLYWFCKGYFLFFYMERGFSEWRWMYVLWLNECMYVIKSKINKKSGILPPNFISIYIFPKSSSKSRSYIWHGHFVECFLPYLHIKDTVKKWPYRKKRHYESSSLISLALHIPLVAQFGIKNAAIAVQLCRIFVQFRELSRPRRDCRRICRRRWRGLTALLSHWKDEGEAEAFCFTNTIPNCMRNPAGAGWIWWYFCTKGQGELPKELTFWKIDFFIFTA